MVRASAKLVGWSVTIRPLGYPVGVGACSAAGERATRFRIRVVVVLVREVLGAAVAGAVVGVVEVVQVVAVVLVGRDHPEEGLQTLQRAHTSALVTCGAGRVLGGG